MEDLVGLPEFFRRWPLAAPEYGEMKQRRKDAKTGQVFAVLVWDDEAGEGEVYLSRDLTKLHPSSAKDAIQDWTGLLNHEYSKWNIFNGREPVKKDDKP
jgi:hypothetical protein